MHASLLVLASALAPLPQEADGAAAAKATAAAAVDEQAGTLDELARSIWGFAELALAERRSSALLADRLEAAGFAVERGVSGMPTAFVASYGEGEPVVAYLAEFDALPGLSQEVAAERTPVEAGGNGHGCGHNLFGSGSVVAGIALARAMEAHDLPGTVRVYGTPAEEHGIGKVFLVRDGRFDDVDACLSWHPADENRVSVLPSKALRSFEATFYGRSAHAAAAPWEGVSALDAVEAFGAGVNLLREHLPETARVHYVITDGGDAPNVVPARARVWAFVRGRDWQEADEAYRHVLAIVDAADRMAWGEEHGDAAAGYRPVEVDVLSGLWHYNPSHTLARVVQAELEAAGAPAFTDEEHAFGRALQEAFGVPAEGMHAEVTPLDLDPADEPGGSTDVANVSWVCPTVDLDVATWPKEVPAHSWASTAASCSDAALRATRTAAKVLAASGAEVLTSPELVRALHAELAESTRETPYVSPVGPDDEPRLPSHLRPD